MAVLEQFLSLVLLFVCQEVLSQDVATGRTEQHPATDFSRHTLIKPRIYHGREKRQISTTKDEGDYHIDHLTIAVPIDGEDLILDLTLNKQLIPKGFFTKTQHKGAHKTRKPTAQEVDLCHYNGQVRGRTNSWVALSTCDGLSGVVFDGVEMHYLEKNPSNSHNFEHFLYKHADLVEHNKTCGYAGDAREPHHHEHNRILRYKRSTKETDQIRGPYNANKESKYVELVLVVDNREFKDLGESVTKVEEHCKKLANIINGLYAPLNIFIALVGVVIWTEHDEISFSENGDTTLTSFLHYRRTKLVEEHPNDNAQLLTKFNFENGVVGKALKGPICTYEYSGGVNMDHSPVVGLVATTVAHEMGHNFGMEHDTNECKCPDDRCIMAPSSSTVAPTHWSSCSLNYLLLAFTHGMDYCLKNKPVSLFSGPVCGNGFVEHGEQCDCGLPENCDNTCCNATTCELHSNASCATGECCDLTTCKPKNAGSLCRSADYECDLPEFCTGQSEYCPSDVYKMNTELCDNGNAFCYHGFCRTRADQCKLLWGETGKSSEEPCYKMNVKGNRHGNCGYNQLNKTFFKCEDEDVLCGMLHCKHLNERLEFGMESVSILSHSFLNVRGAIVACRTAIVDLGINQVDPGLAPDGAKCGEGKMCVNQKCMPVANLQLAKDSCPQNCNNNGVCNNLGHCHCKVGFAPPYCDDVGPGGSHDSGPATDPNAYKEIMSVILIIFLGVVPLIGIIAFVWFYLRRDLPRLRFSKPTPPQSKSPSKSRGGSFSPDAPHKRTEDNHSLLQDEAQAAGGGLHNEFFGHFKGFTLTPMKSETEPTRAAPPPPKAAKVARVESFKQALSFVTSASAAPALPPPNPGSNAKLIISSPILENSTCTAKELISPLRHAPKPPTRAASEPIKEEPKKKESGTTLNRITSFLKSGDKKMGVSSLPRTNQMKVHKIHDKDLRTIQISNPILQPENTITVNTVPVNSEEGRAVVMRAQSMRGKVTHRPKIPNFGSMRQPNFKRPMSIPSGSRPKSPPPPAPPSGDKITIPSLPGYQKPTIKPSLSQYDDCLNKSAPLAQLSEELSPTSSDNIYAVIEESPTSPESSSSKSEEKPKTNSSSTDSMGLLGEIVSEIQNRNFDSIYSTSTLARKKKLAQEAAEKKPEDEIYVNASSPSESVYSNMNNVKSSASSTSSGYIHPSAVNVPVKAAPPVVEPAKFSTFLNKPANPVKPKGVTPPNLRTRKASPARPVSNSPDLVTSCNTKATKTPDVLDGGPTKKPAIVSAKPVLNGLPKAPVKPKGASFNGKVGKVNGEKSVARATSNVASLQQRFEGKGKGVAKTKT